MFYLKKLRDFPPRLRRIDIPSSVNPTGSFTYFPGGTVYPRPGERSLESQTIWDDEPTDAKQNNCVNWKRITTYPGVSGHRQCLQSDYGIFSSANIYAQDAVTPAAWNNALAPYPVDKMMDQRSVQDAIANVYVKQSNKLYRLTSKELPDLTVFFVELMELNQIFSIVKGMLMHGVTLKKSLKTAQRRLKRLKRLKKTVVVKRYIRDTVRAIQTISADIVKWRFGVKTPLRDMEKIITSFTIYLDAIRTYSARMTVRSTEEFAFEDWWGDAAKTGCWGQQCSQLYTNPLFCTHSKVKGKVTYVQVVKNPLRGSALEKTANAVLAQVGMLPSVDSVWEIVRLSWLVDYFARTDILLSKLERLLGLGPKDVIIEESSISFSFEETQDVYSDCWRYGQGLAPASSSEHVYYERLVSDGDIPFVEVVPYIRLPKGTQITTAVAYALMKILIGFRFRT